jgi:hypothetical protein
MALVVTRAVTESYDPNVTDGGNFSTLAAANNNNSAALRRLLRNPTFVAECTTTGSETAVIANSIATLAALGVSFPAGTIRQIRVRVSTRTLVTNGGYSEKVFHFRGNAAIGSVTQVADGNLLTTAPTAYAVPVGMLYDGTNIGIAAAGVDGTAGPFITVWSALPGSLQTSATVNARHRVEIFVDPLIVLPAL